MTNNAFSVSNGNVCLATVAGLDIEIPAGLLEETLNNYMGARRMVSATYGYRELVVMPAGPCWQPGCISIGWRHSTDGAIIHQIDCHEILVAIKEHRERRTKRGLFSRLFG